MVEGVRVGLADVAAVGLAARDTVVVRGAGRSFQTGIGQCASVNEFARWVGGYDNGRMFADQ